MHTDLKEELSSLGAKIKDITDAPRSKIYTIETKDGEVLFPAVSEFVKEIDENRGVFIRPIPGFFDEDEI